MSPIQTPNIFAPLAGVIMWVPGSFPLLLPILRLIVELSTGRVVIVRTHG